MSSIFEPHIQDLNEAPKNKGGSKLKDTELNQLALDANRYIHWPMSSNLQDDPINKLLVANRPTGDYKNVYAMGGGSRSHNYIVRLPICGTSQRIMISEYRIRCARYADAATFYFWKYRRTDRQPEDSDFNTSLEIAKQLAAFPQCAVQLKNLEEYLIRVNIIQTDAQVATEKRVRTFVRDVTVARKYLERSRRYTLLLRDRYALDAAKLRAVADVVKSITDSLIVFSNTIQADMENVVAQIRVEAHAATPAPTKTAEEILFEQAAERARIAREQYANNTNK